MAVMRQTPRVAVRKKKKTTRKEEGRRKRRRRKRRRRRRRGRVREKCPVAQRNYNMLVVPY